MMSEIEKNVTPGGVWGLDLGLLPTLKDSNNPLFYFFSGELFVAQEQLRSTGFEHLQILISRSGY